MKKLLLSLASLALISTSLYAGCTADVDMGGNKITKLTMSDAAGATQSEATNKSYVDNKISGIPPFQYIGKLTNDGIPGTWQKITTNRNLCIVKGSGGFHDGIVIDSDLDANIQVLGGAFFKKSTETAVTNAIHIKSGGGNDLSLDWGDSRSTNDWVKFYCL
jgi:hypothetical protein